MFTLLARAIGHSEDKSIAQHLLLVNEAEAAVLVLRPPADSKQQQTGSSGEFVFVNLLFDSIYTLIQTSTAGNRETQRIDKSISQLLR